MKKLAFGERWPNESREEWKARHSKWGRKINADVTFEGKGNKTLARYRKTKESMYAAFADEMEKIAVTHYVPFIPSPSEYPVLIAALREARKSKEKKASFLTNIGSRIRFSSAGRASEGLLRHPLQSMKGGLRASFRDPATGKVGFMQKGNRLGQGLFIAGTGMSAANALKKDDPNQIGPGRGERIGRFVGGTVSGLAATPYGGIGAGLLVGAAGDAIGGRVGRIADRLRGYKAQRVPPQGQMPTAQQAQPQQAQPIQPQPQGVA